MIRVTAIQPFLKEKRNKEERLQEALRMLTAAPASDLILLPELWLTGFFSFSEYHRESEPLDGPSLTTLRQQVAKLATHVLLGSFIEREDDLLYNTAVMIDPHGEILARYRKIHLFGYQSQEQALLTPGKQPVVFDLPWGRAGIATCYDLRFPELFRLMVEQGATMFLVPSAWPMARLFAWQLFCQARAHENLAWLLSCNCAGSDCDVDFAGNSMLVDPGGQIVARADERGGLVSALIDPTLPQALRQAFPALSDRVFQGSERQ